jgi:protein-S-isoprenylcysteine O-methyltransferase Ste14
MKASEWEFRNRAMVFGIILGLSFGLYSLDSENVTAMAGTPRLLFWFAALVLAAAALIRTWASSYLNASVVYAAEIKSSSLVADGPYRHVRNPLYLANVLMAFGLGSMMSRAGFVFAVVAMWVFCYRLILREESELRASQGACFETYCRAVPRLWPALRPRTASAGSRPKWKEGFKAEFWYWGFAVAVAAFAITLKLPFFFAAMTVSIGLFWITSAMAAKR